MTSRILGSPFKSPGGPILARGTKIPAGSDGISKGLEQSANSQSDGTSISTSMRLQVPERSIGGIRTSADDSIDDKNPGEITNPAGWSSGLLQGELLEPDLQQNPWNQHSSENSWDQDSSTYRRSI